MHICCVFNLQQRFKPVMNQKDHWEQTYSSKPSESLGWYEPHLKTSLSWIEALKLAPGAQIIDIGGGASTLVDDLLEAGYQSISVLDISENALASARSRLGEKAQSVNWVTGDISDVDLPAQHFDLWHDRAVFHFLTRPEQQRQYRDSLLRTLKPGGHLIIGTFSPEAPPKCSGLPVQRYDLELLQSTLGDEFELIRRDKEMHTTPGGVEQMYLYCYFQKRV
jgi:ubiquinone/menaquinone biosynthesis C-methylase UbiE